MKNGHEFPFPDVDGFLSDQDRHDLKMLSGRCATLPGDFCEIGSYKGLSALCIIAGMVGFKYLYCYDYFEPDKLPVFLENTAAYQARVTPVIGDFKNASLAGKHFCFCFCDHSHTLEDTKAAYEMFWPRITNGGVFCCHDFGHEQWPESTEYLKSLPHHRVIESSIIAFLKE
jgi:predicted O-methyltransferase YrrM